MSDQTKADLAAAISAHIADEGDSGTLGAWIVIAEDTSLAEYVDSTGSMHITVDGGHYAVRGLVETYVDIARTSVTRGGDDE